MKEKNKKIMTPLKNIFKAKASIFFLLITTGAAFSQGTTTAPVTTTVNEGRTPTPALPFLLIATDARSAAMGDAGVATATDVNAIFWNPARLAVADKSGGITASFTPWLRALVDDMSLLNIAGYKQFGNYAFGLSINYFNQGEFTATDAIGTEIGKYKSNEYAIAGSGSMKLSDKSSLGLNIKYLVSDLTGGLTGSASPTLVAQTAAADISYFFNMKRDKKWNYTFGAMISNIGGKVSYGDKGNNFLPTNLKLGMAGIRMLDTRNKLTLTADINKLMTPTPPKKDASGKIIAGGYNPDKDNSALGVAFSSFGDAPDGFSEELKEFTLSLGAEYLYNNMFAIRAGYHDESEQKGNRKYFTTGLGLKYQEDLSIDLGYMIPVAGKQSPLANTWRISLAYHFE
jgi:hypothetical protein